MEEEISSPDDDFEYFPIDERDFEEDYDEDEEDEDDEADDFDI